jgi:hypothetical protein
MVPYDLITGFGDQIGVLFVKAIHMPPAGVRRMLRDLFDERPVQETGDLVVFVRIISNLEANWRPTVHSGRIIVPYGRAEGKGQGEGLHSG